MPLKESRPRQDGHLIIGTEVRHVYSECVGREFRLTVGLPHPKDRKSGLPVIYGLDGSAYSGLLIDCTRALSPDPVPSAIIVGIDYPFEMDRPFRMQDYTPTSNPKSDEDFSIIHSLIDGSKVESVPSGGAPAFLRFIQDELKLFIEAEYGGDPANATFTGHSLGGLFGAYVLLTETAAFRRYNLVSPSLWWNDQVILKREVAFAAASKLLNAKVFLSCGGLESEAAQAAEDAKFIESMPKETGAALRDVLAKNRHLMLELVVPFGEQLTARNYEGLELTTHVFENETHGSVYAPALNRGLRTLFAAY